MRASVLVTIGSVFAWAALAAANRILLLRFGLDPWTFTFVQMCAGGAALLATCGWGRLDLASFCRPATWVIGALRVLSAALYASVLARVSVLDSGILGAVNMSMVAVSIWLVFGRRPARCEWPGHVVIVISILLLVADLPGGLWNPAVLLMSLNEVCMVATTLLAERHPDNVSDDPRPRLQFTGALLLITAVLFLAVRTASGETMAAVWNWRLLVAGAAVGVALRAPSMLLTFWSIRLAGAQNYVAALSLLPLLGMVFEHSASIVGLIHVSHFEADNVPLALGVVAGTVLVVAARARMVRLAVPASSG